MTTDELERRLHAALTAEANRLPASTTTAADIADHAAPTPPRPAGHRARRLIAVGAGVAAVVATASASGLLSGGHSDHTERVGSPPSSTVTPHRQPVVDTEVGAGTGPQLWPACINPRDPNFSLTTGDEDYGEIPFGTFRILQRGLTKDSRPYVYAYQTGGKYVHLTACIGDARGKPGANAETLSTSDYTNLALNDAQNPLFVDAHYSPTGENYLAVTVPKDAVTVRVLDGDHHPMATLVPADELATPESRVAAGAFASPPRGTAFVMSDIVSYDAAGREIDRIRYDYDLSWENK